MDLAAHMAGIETVAFCEINPFAQKVLQKRFPGIPIIPDIHELTKENLLEILNQNGGGLHDKESFRIDIISGGFPCQAFSFAGKQRGKEDDRYLWPEMFRVIKEFRPRWVVGENVVGIVKLALDTVLFDLESAGYTSQTFIIPACGVGAPHRRERVFVVAYSSS